MFKHREEVINLETGLAGYCQADEKNGMVTVKWIQYGVPMSTIPVSQLMNSSDHLRMMRAREIEPYKSSLRALAYRWRDRSPYER